MVTTPRIRTLRRAAETLGGEQALAAALGVRVKEVLSWLTGQTAPDDRAFFRALDIVALGKMRPSAN